MPEQYVSRKDGVEPEEEALLADSVGLALLVVLERLSPAEQLAFVLHDLFALPIDEIAPIVGRSPVAARQVRGAKDVAEQALIFARRSRFAQLARVNGDVGVVVAPRGRLIMVLAFKFTGQKIVEIEIIAEPARLRQIDLAILDG